MAEYTEAQTNVLKENDLFSPLVLMTIYETFNITGRDGLIVSIAKAMESRIAKKDRLTGVSPSSFRSLIKDSIEIETRNKITMLEKQINENRGEPLKFFMFLSNSYFVLLPKASLAGTGNVAFSAEPSTSDVAKPTAPKPSTSGVQKNTGVKRPYNRKKPCKFYV